MTYDLLLDVGGTGIKGSYYCLDDNETSQVYYFPSNAEKGKEAIIQHFISLCAQIWEGIAEEGKTIRSIRMAFPGPFDYGKGISLMQGLAKYESLYGVSIPHEMIKGGITDKVKFTSRDRMDFLFINDVEAYARGVMYKRKLHEGYRVIYLCIGTGAGTAYSINGSISDDRQEGIPEKGWAYPVPFQSSIIDDYISVRGINKLSLKYCNRLLTPLELSEMAIAGDREAIAAYKEFGENLNAAFLPLLKSFKANTFVIGGNISRSGSLFLSKIEEECEKQDIHIMVEEDTSGLIMEGLTGL